MLVGNSKLFNLFVLFSRWKGNAIPPLRISGGHISIEPSWSAWNSRTVLFSAPMPAHCGVLISSVLLGCVRTPLLF